MTYTGVSVPTTDKLCPALLMKVTDMPLKALRQEITQGATSLNPKPSTGEGGSNLACCYFLLSSKGRYVPNIHFQTILEIHYHFILLKVLQRKVFDKIVHELGSLFQARVLWFHLGLIAFCVRAILYLKLN